MDLFLNAVRRKLKRGDGDRCNKKMSLALFPKKIFELLAIASMNRSSRNSGKELTMQQRHIGEHFDKGQYSIAVIMMIGTPETVNNQTIPCLKRHIMDFKHGNRESLREESMTQQVNTRNQTGRPSVHRGREDSYLIKHVNINLLKAVSTAELIDLMVDLVKQQQRCNFSDRKKKKRDSSCSIVSELTKEKHKFKLKTLALKLKREVEEEEEQEEARIDQEETNSHLIKFVLNSHEISS
ncbi:hypothetical protein H5410_025043 [Solanum commersonii]|uniref:Uncharacterized protein n=1 Tax=Solanum commersonii TaxID=4109 RepID=A0A9J5YUT8_SOLCO|nr:hypothetical protein H5410_025043 [Solanum commersonii]